MFKPKPGSNIAVRMYCQGFGDCFLVAVKDGASVKHIVIDCGIHKSCKNKEERMREVVASIRKETGGNLAALAITHEHYDHVMGFEFAKDEWNKFTKIDEIWAGWTENEEDPDTKRIRQHGKDALRIAQTALHHMPAFSLRREEIESIFASTGDDVRAARDFAIQLGKEKGAKIEYFEPMGLPPEPRDEDLPPAPPSKPAIKFGDFHLVVLGPPRGEKLAKMEKSSEMFFQARANLDSMSNFLGLNAAPASDYLDRLRQELGLPRSGDGEDQYQPFDSQFRFSATDPRWDLMPPDERIQIRYRSEPWRAIDDAWVADAADLALNTDGITNNTSLAFALIDEAGKSYLFVGDAQIGNWQSWGEKSYPVNGQNIGIDQILGNVAFYKVGHHASHNATMKSSLHKMPSSNLVSMVTVETGFYKSIPKAPLMDELKRRGPVQRMDEAGSAQAPFEPSPTISQWTQRPLYVEVHL